MRLKTLLLWLRIGFWLDFRVRVSLRWAGVWRGVRGVISVIVTSGVASLHGKPIHRIFAEDGEAEFRCAEREAVAELLQIRPAAVIALGGGAFLDPDNRLQIQRYGVSVWIDIAPQVIAERLGNVKTRPLLTRDATPLAALERLYEERKAIYAQADYRLAAGHTNNTQTLDALEELFTEHEKSL